MKSIFKIIVLLIFSVKGCSQDFRKFRVDFSFDPISRVPNQQTAFTCFEPGYRITDKILINARFEGIYGYMKETGSYGINGQYYFLIKKRFRPFVGLGVGANKPGFYFHNGFDLGHFSFALDYSIGGIIKAKLDSSSFKSGFCYENFL